MLAVAFQGPEQVEVVEKPEPELLAPDDALVRITATGVCGSDLHIYHGRVQIEPGFTIGHEYVGEVVAAGGAVSGVAVGDHVLGTFQVACGACWFCRRSEYHKCDAGRTFGHGAGLGSLQGTQAEMALIPHANLTLRRVPPACPMTSRCSPATSWASATTRSSRRACAPATASPFWASGRSACAPCRSRCCPARDASSPSTRSPSASPWPRRSEPSRCTSPRRIRAPPSSRPPADAAWTWPSRRSATRAHWTWRSA